MKDKESGDDSQNLDNRKGMANVLNKILKTNKPKRKKTVVLAKAKKLSASNATMVPADDSNTNELLLHNNRVKNHEWALKGRMKPNPLERNREKALLKITTRGVVDLFNAVNQHKNKNTKSAPAIEKVNVEAMDKSKFLGILLGSNGS